MKKTAGKIISFSLGLALGLALSWSSAIEALAGIVESDFFKTHGAWLLSLIGIFVFCAFMLVLYHKFVMTVYNKTIDKFASERKDLARETAVFVLHEYKLTKGKR
jgi:hypothetical protein